MEAMTDLIERQAAIDAVIKRDANCGIDSAEVIKALPSAQPETHDKRTETHSCDYISRAGVEQTVEDNILCYTHSDRPIDQDPDTECHRAIRTALRTLRKDLRKLPPAQPALPEWAQRVKELQGKAPQWIKNPLAWALYQASKEYDA